jgi:hypothetical protein
MSTASRRPPWVAAAIVALFLASAAPASAAPPIHRSTVTGADQVTGAEMGAYEWHDATWWPDPSAYTDTLDQLQSLGVNTLYVDITQGVTLLLDHSDELTGFESAFAQLVGEAHADGVAVEAVGGDPLWATSQKKGPAELLSVVAQITAANPGLPLGGVQFDVEPWGLKHWRSHRVGYAKDWLRFIGSTVTAWQSDGLSGRLGFTVPYWFDGDTGGVPRVTLNGSTNYPFQLALAALAPLPETSLNVMAYRNTTGGVNGSEALFGGNMNAASSAGTGTELLAGQETGDVQPAETTFYGLPCSTFQTATGQIADAFDGDTPYEGIAVDDVESLEALCPA